MARYTDIDNTYLATSVTRIAAGLKAATWDILQTRQYTKPEEPLVGPYWDVRTTGFQKERTTSGSHIQTWEVTSTLVYENNTNQLADAVTASLIVFPVAHNYMEAHLSLRIATDDTPIPYLMVDRVSVNLIDINADGLGMRIVHRLPYLIVLQQEH